MESYITPQIQMKKESFVKILAVFVCFALLPHSLLAFTYKVEFEGVKEKKMLEMIEENATSIVLKDKKNIESFSQLRKRAEADLKKLKKIADAFGYFGSEIDFSIIRGPTPKLVFRFDLGQPYTIKSITTDPENIAPLSQLEIIGKNASFETIAEAEDKLLQKLKNTGYAFCKVQHHDLIANKKDKSVILRFSVDCGPKVSFGPLRIHGNVNVSTKAILIHVPWKEGKVYNKNQIDAAQQSLEATGLFSTVVVSNLQDNIQGTTLPIDLYVTEAKHKSISSGLCYNTYKGPGALLSWEHRNLFGYGNKFTASTEVWKREQDVKLLLNQPHCLRYDQDCLWVAEFSRKDILPYFSESTSLSSILERHIDKHWEAFFGLKGEYLRSISDEGHSIYHLAKAPAGLKWSHVDNALDPTKGVILSIKFTPVYQLYQDRFGYAIHTTTLSAYQSIFTNKATGALKMVYGNIVGASRYTIPKPDRFFSGSENTLRGYKYYSVSPLDDKHRPIGGRSLIALSAEARFRTESPLGWVLFYDMGNVYSTNIPTFKDFLYSVGVGMRYMTPIGPLRFDIAVPLRRRPHVDSLFQIYCSIGQSF